MYTFFSRVSQLIENHCNFSTISHCYIL